MAISDVIYPSGYASPSGLYLFSVFDNASNLLAIVSGMSSKIRLFEADDLLLYGGSSLLRYNGEIERLSGYTSTVCMTSDNYVVTLSNIGNPISARIKYQKQPLLPSNWLSSPTVINLVSNDAISDDQGSQDLPILVGNARLNTTIKIYQDDTNSPPFTPFIKSDTGIPVSSVINDLEATI